MATARHATTDDLVSMCVGRQVGDGEMLVRRTVTLLAVTGYLSSRLLQAFRFAFAWSAGDILCRKGTTPGLIPVKGLWLDQAPFIWSLAAGTGGQQPCSVPPRRLPHPHRHYPSHRGMADGTILCLRAFRNA